MLSTYELASAGMKNEIILGPYTFFGIQNSFTHSPFTLEPKQRMET